MMSFNQPSLCNQSGEVPSGVNQGSKCGGHVLETLVRSPDSSSPDQ